MGTTICVVGGEEERREAIFNISWRAVKRLESCWVDSESGKESIKRFLPPWSWYFASTYLSQGTTGGKESSCLLFRTVPSWTNTSDCRSGVLTTTWQALLRLRYVQNNDIVLCISSFLFSMPASRTVTVSCQFEVVLHISRNSPEPRIDARGCDHSPLWETNKWCDIFNKSQTLRKTGSTTQLRKYENQCGCVELSCMKA